MKNLFNDIVSSVKELTKNTKITDLSLLEKEYQENNTEFENKFISELLKNIQNSEKDIDKIGFLEKLINVFKDKKELKTHNEESIKLFLKNIEKLIVLYKKIEYIEKSLYYHNFLLEMKIELVPDYENSEEHIKDVLLHFKSFSNASSKEEIFEYSKIILNIFKNIQIDVFNEIYQKNLLFYLKNSLLIFMQFKYLEEDFHYIKNNLCLFYEKFHEDELLIEYINLLKKLADTNTENKTDEELVFVLDKIKKIKNKTLSKESLFQIEKIEKNIKEYKSFQENLFNEKVQEENSNNIENLTVQDDNNYNEDKGLGKLNNEDENHIDFSSKLEELNNVDEENLDFSEQIKNTNDIKANNNKIHDIELNKNVLNKKILIVEENNLNLKILESILNSSHFKNIEKAADEEDFFTILEKFNIEVLILPYKIFNTNAYELICKLEYTQFNSKEVIILVATSQKLDEEDVNNLLEQNVDAIVEKPIQPFEIKKAIKEFSYKNKSMELNIDEENKKDIISDLDSDLDMIEKTSNIYKDDFKEQELGKNIKEFNNEENSIEDDFYADLANIGKNK